MIIIRYFFWWFILKCLGGQLSSRVTIGRGVKIRLSPNSPIKIGSGSVLGDGVVLSAVETGSIVIGENVSIGKESVILSRIGIEVKNNSQLGQRVFIGDFNHGYSDKNCLISHQKISAQPIVIESDVQIEDGAKILMGVHIGSKCRIKAGSVVTHSVAAGSIVAGIPATLLAGGVNS